MTVGEMISELSNYKDDDIVLFKPDNSIYPEAIGNDWHMRSVNKFYGDNDNLYLIINSDGQIGAL